MSTHGSVLVPKDRLFPFPPKDPRILVSGGRVGFLGKARKEKKIKKRKYCSRGGYREQPKMSAMRGGFTISTLNVDTLKVKATDTFTLRKSIRVHQIVGFMKSQCADIMNLQETRLTFQGDDPILHRKLFLNGILIHLYLMSAVNGYNGMAIISRYPLNVEKVSDRIMKANLLLENTKACLFNVYSPTATANTSIQGTFVVFFSYSFSENGHADACQGEGCRGSSHCPVASPHTPEEEREAHPTTTTVTTPAARTITRTITTTAATTDDAITTINVSIRTV